jgi:hypothetical protein
MRKDSTGFARQINDLHGACVDVARVTDTGDK